MIDKWLLADCDNLIIDEPTVGVDVSTKLHIHEIIGNLAKQECKTTILISLDMAEMITLARRILLFKDFHISTEITGLDDRIHAYDEVSTMIANAM